MNLLHEIDRAEVPILLMQTHKESRWNGRFTQPLPSQIPGCGIAASGKIGKLLFQSGGVTNAELRGDFGPIHCGIN